MSKRSDKLRPLTESKRYEDFIRGRDHGLQDVLSKYTSRIDDVVALLQQQAEQVAAHLATARRGHAYAKRNRDEFVKRLTPWFELGIHQTAALIKGLRRTTYVLSYVGQAEAIGRAIAQRTKVNLSPDEIRQVVDRETLHGGGITPRVELAFHRMLRDVVDAYQLSQVMDSNVLDTIARLDRAFPKKRKLPPRKMAPMKESARDRREPPGVDDPLIVGVQIDNGFSHFVTDQEWADSIEDYFADYIPAGRGPYDNVFHVNETTGEDESRYQWQVEQEMADDFIQSVRSGEVDSANANGITDGVWIALLDKKTCKDCCLPRDGLLSSEIEAKLESGELNAEDCDAIIPPGHGWCRCRWAGATEDLPAKNPPDFGSWDDWLEKVAGSK